MQKYSEAYALSVSTLNLLGDMEGLLDLMVDYANENKIPLPKDGLDFILTRIQVSLREIGELERALKLTSSIQTPNNQHYQVIGDKMQKPFSRAQLPKPLQVPTCNTQNQVPKTKQNLRRNFI